MTTVYIWFPYKTPDFFKCPYNTPLHEVRKQFFGHDLGQFSLLLGFLYGFRIRTQASRRSKGVYRTSNTLASAVQNMGIA